MLMLLEGQFDDDGYDDDDDDVDLMMI